VGTGLGLSVSYFIITNNHNGFMAAESSPGEGACFSIRLPLTDPMADSTTEPSGLHNGSGPKERSRVH
jgi:signal transduction histidine kinase